MNTIEINKRLHRIALGDHDDTIRYEIATQAIENENPARYLEEMYKNNGLRYDLDDPFFFIYVEDIVQTIENHKRPIEIKLSLDNYPIELSFLAYQITLQNMMISFGMIKEEDAAY